MPLRFAINGLGRVGRALLRVAAGRPELELVAVNDLVPAATLTRLLARDTVHGPAPFAVAADGAALVVAGRRVAAHAVREAGAVPWSEAGAAVVVEATGRFASGAAAAAHLGGSVERVVVTANAPGVDATFCFGVNEASYDPATHRVVSNASCTTNCLALVAKVLHDGFGIQRALMSTVHAYTESQRLLDVAHQDARRGRAAAANIIPVATTSAAALGEVLPDLAGKVEGFSVRVPTPAVAMLDFVAELAVETTAAALREAFRAAAEGPLARLLGVTDEEPVSSDFIGEPRSAVVDLPLVQVSGGRLSRVVAWYDNEWGYANRLADLLALLARSA
jgi:glyceraldehyde 3-phosphate dehydrogenase